MNIAILGSGNVGSALAKRWTAAGHAVVFGARDPSGDKAQAAAAAAGAAVATPAEAVVGADAVLLAVPFSAVGPVLAAAGDLSGKVLMDATNPLKPGLAGLDAGAHASAGEAVAALAPGAAVVKIFNTTGAGNMADPAYPTGPVTMLYAGDDAAAKAVAAGLAADAGFAPQDAGPLSASRLLEHFAMLWISLAYQRGLGPNFALVVARRG